MSRGPERHQSMPVAGPVSAGSGRKRHALSLFSGIAADYDRVGAVLSLGQDPRWRRALIDSMAPVSTDRVLDVATGTGLIAARLVRCYGCAVVGLDQSVEMLEAARSGSPATPAWRRESSLCAATASDCRSPMAASTR